MLYLCNSTKYLTIHKKFPTHYMANQRRCQFIDDVMKIFFINLSHMSLTEYGWLVLINVNTG